MNTLLQEIIDIRGLTLEEIKTPLEGELLEGATDNCTFQYGNGELIVNPDTDEDSTVYVIDNIHGRDMLVEF